MGYTTDFYGSVTVEPPLNDAERDYLKRFSESRRMKRAFGPYLAQPGDNHGQERAEDILEYNEPPNGQPGLWCQWIPNADGSAIGWDGGEKFYDGAEWMTYIIVHFLMPGAVVQRLREIEDGSVKVEPAFADFTFDHHVSGTIEARGEEEGDIWQLDVEDNRVYVRHAKVEVSFGDRQEVALPTESE